jgi:hypothetical protein
VPIQFAALDGRHFVVTFTGIRPEIAANYYSAGPLVLPLGIAEIGIPGVQAPATPAQLPGNCTSGLLSIDGQPVGLRIVGSTESALNNDQVTAVPCGPDANGITLGAGTHVVQSAVAHNPACAGNVASCTGWNIDQIVLDSAAGGGAGPVVGGETGGTPELPATQPGHAPQVRVTSNHVDGGGATVTGAASPFELILGQSVNSGWQAQANPGPGAPGGSHAVNLGTSQLVDGFANGWAVTQADLHALGGPDFTVSLTWTPQRDVWIALTLSGATLLVCLLLGVLPARWRRRLRARLPARLRGRAAIPVSHSTGGPVLALPFQLESRVAGTPVPVVKKVAAGLLTGVVASGVTSVTGGLLVAVIVVGGLLVPRARMIATLGGVFFVLAGGLNVVFEQADRHYLPGSNWASSFVPAGNLIWFGLALLLADAVIASFPVRSNSASS